MSIAVNVNGESINYPQTGDTNWGDEATDFAVQTSSAFAKVGLSSGTTVDIPGTLDVTGATTLDSTLTVAGIVNVDSGVLYVDPTNNRVGINDTTPSEALDVTGNAIITGNLAVDTNTLYVDATNNRVGIVNSSPSKALDVTGEIQSSSHITCNGVVYADDDTTANTPVISFIGDTNTGIGRSAADTIDLITDGNSKFRIASTGQINAVVPNGTTFYPGYLCRAWVNFNGRGTVGQNQTIRGSANISSVVKNATGDYTINIDIDMPDANYATFATGRNQGSSVSNNILLGYYSTNSFDTTEYNAGSVRITSKLSNDVGWIDLDYISVGIFR